MIWWLKLNFHEKGSIFVMLSTRWLWKMVKTVNIMWLKETTIQYSKVVDQGSLIRKYVGFLSITRAIINSHMPFLTGS